jgi:hypothetical protein
MSNQTENQKLRGSEKLMAAWKNRALTDESVLEISRAIAESPAKVLGASVIGGANASGLQLSLGYEGDGVPQCGNDLLFWLKWHIKHGGTVKPPRIIINGTPFPDLVKMELVFGNAAQPGGIDPEIGQQFNQRAGFG